MTLKPGEAFLAVLGRPDRRTPAQQAAMAALWRFACVDSTTVPAEGVIDPLRLALLEGRRQVVLWIEAEMAAEMAEESDGRR